MSCRSGLLPLWVACQGQPGRAAQPHHARMHHTRPLLGSRTAPGSRAGSAPASRRRGRPRPIARSRRRLPARPAHACTAAWPPARHHPQCRPAAVHAPRQPVHAPPAPPGRPAAPRGPAPARRRACPGRGPRSRPGRGHAPAPGTPACRLPMRGRGVAAGRSGSSERHGGGRAVWAAWVRGAPTLRAQAPARPFPTPPLQGVYAPCRRLYICWSRGVLHLDGCNTSLSLFQPVWLTR